MAREQDRYKGLSARARALLARDEGLDVDFKKTVKSVEQADLVAFANSEGGGTLLIGVEDGVAENGEQRGQPIGCKVGDDSKLQLMNRALDCVPPVRVRLVVENANKVPFYRLEIPESTDGPHCTKRGTYKIRENGRNAALLPDELLTAFMRRETKEFQERFRGATASLSDAVEAMHKKIAMLESAVDSRLSDIVGSVDWASYSADDANDTAKQILDEMRASARQSRHGATRLAKLVEHHGLPDPVKERAALELEVTLLEEVLNDPEVARKLMKGSASFSHRDIDLFSREDLGQIVGKVRAAVQKAARAETKRRREAAEAAAEAERSPDDDA